MQLHLRFLWSTVTILLAVSAADAASSGCGICGELYTAVNRTESIKAIATFCNVTVSSFFDQNSTVIVTSKNSSYHLNTYSVLRAGDSFPVPCSGDDSFDCGPCGVRYVSSGGENATEVAAKCAIQAAILGPFSLTQSGDVVSIPCTSETLQTSPLSCGICGTVASVTGPSNTSVVTLDKIAGACNASLSALEVLNPAQANTVYGGTKVYIPCLHQSPICGSCGNSYKVAEGDTYFKIAEFCDVSLSALLGANPQAPSNPTYLQAGYILRIPCALDRESIMPSSSPMLLADNLHAALRRWCLILSSPAVIILLL